MITRFTILRVAVTLLGLLGAALAIFLLVHFDVYLQSLARRIALAVMVAGGAMAVYAGLRYRVVAGLVVTASVSALGALYLAETALWLMRPLEPAGPTFPAENAQSALLQAAHREGRAVYPLANVTSLLEKGADGRRIPTTMLAGEPALKLGGVSESTTLFFDETKSRWTEVSSDRYGHRNPDLVWDLAPVDALVVGASHVVGFAAAPDSDFVSLFGNDRKVARLGIGGISELFKLAMLREYGPLISPKIVYWAYSDRNDLQENLTAELSTPTLSAYLDPGFRRDVARHEAELSTQLRSQMRKKFTTQDAVFAPNPTSHPIEWTRVARLERLRLRVGLTGSPVPKANLLGWRQAMLVARNSVAAWNGQLVILYLPMIQTLKSRRNDPVKVDIERILDELDIPIVDMTPVFFRSAAPISYFTMPDGALNNHYVESGHRLIAACLAWFFDRHVVLRSPVSETCPAREQ